jgi:hypothetical protein
MAKKKIKNIELPEPTQTKEKEPVKQDKCKLLYDKVKQQLKTDEQKFDLIRVTHLYDNKYRYSVWYKGVLIESKFVKNLFEEFIPVDKQ